MQDLWQRRGEVMVFGRGPIPRAVDSIVSMTNQLKKEGKETLDAWELVGLKIAELIDDYRDDGVVAGKVGPFPWSVQLPTRRGESSGQLERED